MTFKPPYCLKCSTWHGPDDGCVASDLPSIPGEGSGPKPWRRRSLADPEQVTCWRCEREIGVATSAVVKVVIAPLRAPGGKKTGGTEVWVCAYCLSRGVITELIKA